MTLPFDYVIQSIYTHCRRVVYKKCQGVYNAECCVCHEGSSAGRKRRLFYFPEQRYFYCFNCNRSWSVVQWLQDVTGQTVSEILSQSEQFVPDISSKFDSLSDGLSTKVTCTNATLPDDVVDICDNTQVNFYKEDQERYVILERAIQYCESRRLFTAINRPHSFYISFDDYIHSNRLIIPFYDCNNKIFTYQSRTLEQDVFPKYLTKSGDKCFYGQSKIEDMLPYLFIFEGPIDSMFVRNGLGVGGSSVTAKQRDFLDTRFDQVPIYVFDNDKNNKEMYDNVLRFIERGERVFIWPREFSEFKDINEICCRTRVDSISPDFFVKNSFTGLEAKVKFLTNQKQINRRA